MTHWRESLGIKPARTTGRKRPHTEDMRNLSHAVSPWILGLTLLCSLACKENVPASGSSAETGNVPSGNIGAPPIIQSASIVPPKPSASSELSLKIVLSKESPKEVNYQYQWFLNGEQIPGALQSTLTPGNFRRGDRIQCRITGSAGLAVGPAFQTGEVEVANTAPTIADLRIEPEIPTRTTGVKASYVVADLDQDLLTTRLEWKIGTQTIEGDESLTFPGELLKRGDRISFTVTTSDELATVSKSSGLVRIGNSVPQILTTPPDFGKGEEAYTYQVQAKDPDGDQLRFSVSGPTGLGIGSDGLITWRPQEKQSGTHTIRVEVTDPQGAMAIQEFQLALTVSKEIQPTPSTQTPPANP